jgi:hypothetical protein
MVKDIVKKYEKMCEKSVKLNTEIDDNEGGHVYQDKVYRSFINDICKGELCSLKDIKSVAQMIKKDVVKYDGPNKRWYA